MKNIPQEKKRKKEERKKSICQHWQTFRILWEYKYILWYDLVSWVCACVDWQETEDCFTLKHRQCSELYNEWVCVRGLVCGGLGMFQRVSAHGHTLKHSAGAVVKPWRLNQTPRLLYTWLEPCPQSLKFPPTHLHINHFFYPFLFGFPPFLFKPQFWTYARPMSSCSLWQVLAYYSYRSFQASPICFPHSRRNSSATSLNRLFVPIYSLYKCARDFPNPAISFFFYPPPLSLYTWHSLSCGWR